jgi:hypothetical protein
MWKSLSWESCDHFLHQSPFMRGVMGGCICVFTICLKHAYDTMYNVYNNVIISIKVGFHVLRCRCQRCLLYLQKHVAKFAPSQHHRIHRSFLVLLQQIYHASTYTPIPSQHICPCRQQCRPYPSAGGSPTNPASYAQAYSPIHLSFPRNLPSPPRHAVPFAASPWETRLTTCACAVAATLYVHCVLYSG